MASKQEQKVTLVTTLDSDAQWEFTALLPDGSRRQATPAESAEEETKHRNRRGSRPVHAGRITPLPRRHPGQLEPAAYFRWKGILDRIMALLLLPVAAPIIATLVVLVRLTSRGPGIYRQLRVGKDGRAFLMYKIRTMRHDAETATGPVWAQVRDTRLTLIGRVLRKLHLDELPQLFNVLRGEMSLIGPRPERLEFVRVLADAVPGYASRLAVCPGITGLAQVNLPPDTDLESVQRKLLLDVEYIRKANLWMDLRLFLCIALRLFKLPEKRLLRLFRLHRNVRVHATAAEDSSCPPTTPAILEHLQYDTGHPSEAHGTKVKHRRRRPVSVKAE